MNGRTRRGNAMLQMNYWTDKWDLHEDVCPCDVHFNEWVADQGLKNKTIFHFGTGTHHVVGIEQARNGSNNAVIAITASIEEYEAYIKLVSTNSAVAQKLPRVFRRHLSDQSAPAAGFRHRHDGAPVRVLLPEHGEPRIWRHDRSAGARPVHRQDAVRRPSDCSTRTRWARSEPRKSFPQWEKEKPVERVGDFKTLIVYRKK